MKEIVEERDPQTCPWGPCGWPKCCEHGDQGCASRVLSPLANALLNERRDQMRLDRDDYEEVVMCDD
jgi:hypothetical protein